VRDDDAAAGWNKEAERLRQIWREEQASKPNGLSSNDDVTPAFSDDALALAFTYRHASELKYVATWGHWLQWDGARWRFEETLAAYDLARIIAREAAQACNNSKARKDIASAKTVAAIERLARADRRHAMRVDIWDADPWLLNTPGGIVDLRTGKAGPSDPTKYITKITAVAPGGDCPSWLAFLDQIMAGDKELIAYLQRVFGYSLTGSTSEHALFFCYGTGANGKGVLIGAVAGIMQDYATTAPMETFTATNTDRHPTDLAGLRGARLVSSQETEEGRRWAEAKIKALTGGDRISARFMRQDFFEYNPQFKLLIAGNHKPGLRGVDEAIRRRLNLIPFTVTIPAAARDRQLPEKLQAEWPGILQWGIDGCLEWQRVGLAPPASVRQATDEYLAEEDALGLWIEERCAQDPAYAELKSELFADWRQWAETAGEYVGSQKRFTQALMDRGFKPDRRGAASNRIFRGLALKPRL